MDESWQMCMGMSASNHNHPPRKSMETSIFATNHVAVLVAHHNHDVTDFSDVFGGPPRSVLCRKLSGDFTWSTSFYEEVFRPHKLVSSRSMKDGKNLPAFKIPANGEGFYSDIFWDDHRGSREGSMSNSKAKSNSSNSSLVLSSEELSPLRSVLRDDVGLPSFASKLRPINVPSRCNSTTIIADSEEAKQQPTFPSNRCSYKENLYVENDYNTMTRSSSYNHGFNRRVTSPETISLGPHSFSVKLSTDDSESEFDSPSSSSSSLCHEPLRAPTDSMHQQQQQDDGDDDEDEDEDEIMSSYVIEINSDFRESNCEAVSVDEAIAWAKESYNAHSSDKSRSIGTEERSSSYESFDLLMDGHATMQSPKIKAEIWDDNVKLWSSGKENNIRFLLSTLHQILLPNSGWNMIPLTSLVESSQVKKAYQKARLCLHPDKLQQRGATLAQKHVADKAFTILQDAWDAFVSRDVFFV